MRLHALCLTAFQAFAGSEHVDFDALGEGGLFLLHGDTGAGKTTLLDAVCFALYGDVPGARSRDARLRSDHAADDVRTEVELEVTLRERRLRIVRRPRQTRPKLRGEGTTEEPPTCTVQVLAEDGSWSVLAARRDESDAELADLLGMSCEQFCQVVLLPQGEFATFLRADSGERQAVLERLFGTDRFTRVEHWLGERRKRAWAELQASMLDVRNVVSRLSEVSGESPPEDWEHEHEALRAWAGRLGVTAEAEQESAAAARREAATARGAAESALADATALAQRHAAHAAAVTELTTWEQRRPQRDEAERTLAAARAAAPVAALLTRGPGVHCRATTAHSHSSPAELRARAEELRGEAGALDALVEVEERLTRSLEELAMLARQAGEADRGAETAATASQDASRRREALDAAVVSARAAGERAERLTGEVGNAQAKAEQAVERDRQATARHQLQDALRRAVDAEQAAHADWLRLREQRLEGMAAELAGTLQPGEPCAVCGATEHPAPAHGADDAPTGATLAERERAAQRAHVAAAAARSEVERRMAAVEAALAAARAVAGDEPADALAARATQLTGELAASRTAADGLADAEQALAALATKIDAHEQAQRDAVRAAAGARATHAERSAALGADRARVAAARGDAASVAERATALREEAEGAEQEAAARDAGFPDAAAARAAIRDDDARSELEQRLRDFDAGLAERRTRVGDLAAALAADAADAGADVTDTAPTAAAPLPDLTALRSETAAARAADDAAARRDALAQERRTAVMRLAHDLDTALTALAPIAEREQLVRELAGLVEGKSAANRLHMRLSAYVLAARLEEVATAATARLERMSNGRYQLIHTDERARGERRAGLELRVVDGWTGQQRAPGTLSGGETFLASLALALGLADVVAAEAGGSRLETLFIDEGFGTLDERTLDEVLDVLDTLREGGRTVGIVSHVPELRQRIPSRLLVVKGRNGSHVEQQRAAVAT